MQHVVWDWNGTLLDDFAINVAAVNDSCASVGGPTVDAATYRAHYIRPIPTFYERLLGRPLEAGEWSHLDETYHHSYRRRLAEASLVTDAESALARVERAGISQSLLSMWEHDELSALVRRFGLEQRFVRVDGQPGRGGQAKLEHLRSHLATLATLVGALRPAATLVIGDSLDDADAAAGLGLRCVLVEHGPHAPEVLAGAGVRSAGSLLDALTIAGIDAGRGASQGRRPAPGDAEQF